MQFCSLERLEHSPKFSTNSQRIKIEAGEDQNKQPLNNTLFHGIFFHDQTNMLRRRVPSDIFFPHGLLTSCKTGLIEYTGIVAYVYAHF